MTEIISTVEIETQPMNGWNKTLVCHSPENTSWTFDADVLAGFG